MTQAGYESLKALLLWSSFHSNRKYMQAAKGKTYKFYPAVIPVNHSNNKHSKVPLTVKICHSYLAGTAYLDSPGGKLCVVPRKLDSLA